MDIYYKIRHCPDFQSLYGLEDDFNKIGLTVQTTQKNRVILCKIVNGKIKADKIIEDFIFIGSIEKADHELSESITEKIIDFVLNTKGKKSKIENIARAWRNGLRMYDSTIVVTNEDVQYVADTII